MAVAPVNKAGEVDYSHIMVAYAGTNQSDFKDIAEDLQGIGSGNRSTVDKGKMADKMKSAYKKENQKLINQ
ncbi:hypothetical protein [Latilactobacillus fragifolii]|uniref:hypothetical protein n=1 Tax=Latilactobacillus fragifolii TaxID=2814244 RepID=UPI001ABA35FE|nr:hypothetical protein [Latilactobacillus fragifolii]